MNLQVWASIGHCEQAMSKNIMAAQKPLKDPQASIHGTVFPKESKDPNNRALKPKHYNNNGFGP